VHEKDSTRHGFHLDYLASGVASLQICDGVPMEPGLFDLLIVSASLGSTCQPGAARKLFHMKPPICSPQSA
jgi:hypothetical protein